MRRVAAAAAALALGVLSACTGQPTQRDKNDTTPPAITLTVTASSQTSDGLQTVAPGATVALRPPGGTALIKATDDKGVAWVELWMTQEKDCNGVHEGPGLAGGPTKRVVGTVTDTSAPIDLTAGVDLNLLPLAHGCYYRFEVWGQAGNAATTPVTATSTAASLTLSP